MSKVGEGLPTYAADTVVNKLDLELTEFTGAKKHKCHDAREVLFRANDTTEGIYDSKVYIFTKDDSLSTKHFNPFSSFDQIDVYQVGDKFVKNPNTDTKTRFFEDRSTGDIYNIKDGKLSLRFDSFLQLVLTPFHAVGTLVEKVAKVASLYPFWAKKEGKYNLKERAISWGKEILRIITLPFYIVAYALAKLWGVLAPHNGLKLSNSVERLYNGNASSDVKIPKIISPEQKA